MVRELIIDVYLLIFKWVFNFFNLFPLKNRVTFVVSFGDNSKYVYDEIRRQNKSVDVVVLFKGKSGSCFQSYDDIKLIPFESFHILQMLQAIYHLATSKHIFVDNYFGFLAVTDFKEDVECIQLWHASGAIKKFGLEDQSVQYRSKKAQERFLRVYEKFHKVVVGSDVMANTFMNAFNLPQESILRTGIPRTDFFYNEIIQSQIVNQFRKENLTLRNKKKILYAPTYRDQQLDEFEMKLDLEKMANELSEDYVVLLRFHPATKCTVNYAELYRGFVYDFSSSAYGINELLVNADYLITDYSSIPYEFSLLNKPMIFFAYDLETYQKERGLCGQYENMVPGPIVDDTLDIIHLIKENQFNLEDIKRYARRWNKYSTGRSSEKLIQYIFKEDTVTEEVRRRAL
ncbi:CDP-glycerol glycerophosphotransferase family protein [Bacillus sp. V3B]|uniref:CDP-glycerol glycerophosphotransferase family protein n=1 Tax=Bacillus sp. V3B TaxID=2804915 RepID=UPI00210E909B|nr:CDP-glycerol glycerophosphotransferase family protein [Bacillus sp. V3B]MCQ6276845.1 CDP-glycerol glycerophosphotransferase family protein [Bacillus sp. V3B]